MDTMALPLSPKHHLKRTYSDSRLGDPLPDSIEASTPGGPPVISTSEPSMQLPLSPSQLGAPAIVADPATTISHSPASFNATIPPAANTSSSTSNSAMKRTKLTETEKEVKLREKQVKEQEKAKQKAKKEEDKIRRGGEKAKKDEERRVKDAEKERKRQEKEEQTRLKEEEKRKKEEEKEKKHKVRPSFLNVGFIFNNMVVSTASQCFLCSTESHKRWVDCIITPGEPIACQ